MRHKRWMVWCDPNPNPNPNPTRTVNFLHWCWDLYPNTYLTTKTKVIQNLYIRPMVQKCCLYFNTPARNGCGLTFTNEIIRSPTTRWRLLTSFNNFKVLFVEGRVGFLARRPSSCSIQGVRHLCELGPWRVGVHSVVVRFDEHWAINKHVLEY